MMMMTKSYRTFEKSDDGDDSKTVHDKVSMLEKFVLSDDPADFYKTLIQGSDMYRFFRCNEVLSHNDQQLIEPRKGEICSFVKDIKNSQSKVLQYEVLFRWLLNQIDFEADPAARQQLMRSFCKEFIDLGSDIENFYKQRVAGGQQAQGSTSGQCSLLEEALLSHRKNPDYFKAGTALDRCYLQEFDLKLLAQARDPRRPEKTNRSIVEETPFLSTQRNAVEAVAWWLQDQDSSSHKRVLALFRKMTLAQVLALLRAVPRLLDSEDTIEEYLAKKLELSDRIAALVSDPRSVLQLLGEVSAALEELREFAPKKELFSELLSYHRLVRLRYAAQDPDPARRLDLEALVGYLSEAPAVKCELLKQATPGGPLAKERRASRLNIVPQLPAVGEAELSKIILDHLHQVKLDAPTAAERRLLDLLVIEAQTRKQLITERLLRGELIQEVMSHFSEIELNMLRDSKVLRLVEENKLSFGPADKVSLKLEVKAIKNLIVNVFQVNTLNYYAAHQRLVDSRIDLSGLLPTKQLTLEYSQQNMTRHFETFEFEQISATERGIFIVEFIGNGLATRALIKKGGLNLIQIGEDNGLQFAVLDESTNICRGPETYLLLNSKQYAADENGCILLPYQQEALSCFVQVVHRQYSELYSLVVPALQVSLDFSLLYNEEALVGGEVASFLLTPKLYFNQRVVGLDYLRNVGLFVTAQDCEGVLNSQSFNDLALSAQDPLSVEYRLPKKVARITFDLRGEVKLASSQQEVRLSEKRTVNFVQTSHSKNAHLGYSKASGFSLSVLGLNGEPVPDHPLSTSLSNFVQWPRIQASESRTAADGRVLFGELSGVHELMASSFSSDFQSRSWPLRNYMRYKNIPALMSMVEGEELMLPALHEEVAPASHILLRTCSAFSQVYEDCSAQVQKEKGMLFLTGLKAGHYRFTYVAGAALGLPTIQITVLKGRRWEGSSEFLINDRVIQRLQNQSNYLSFDDLKVAGSELSLRVFSNQPEHVKVRLLAYNFLPANFRHIEKSLESLTVQEPRTEYQISSNYNEYLSEKEISDEVKYVIARQNLDIFMGNTLERPTGLLKKEFNKTTAPDSQATQTSKDFRYCTARPGSQVRSLRAMQYVKKPAYASASLDVSAGFLRNRGELLVAGEADADGRVSIDVSQVQAFPYFVVVIEDLNNFLYEVVCNREQEAAPPLRDTRLAESRSQDKYCIHQRVARPLAAGQSLAVLDPKNTELSAVADLHSIFLMVKTISENSALSEWDFLLRWHALTPKEKLQKYNKYLGHELNVFAFFKDKKFWELVVKKHMANKTNKTFIDYFVLQDANSLLKHCSPQGIAALNAIELCLLVYFLKQTGDQARAQAVRDYLESLVRAAGAANDLHYNIRFDSALRFKASSPEELEGDARTLGSKGGLQAAAYLASGEDSQDESMAMRRGGGKRHGGLAPAPRKDCNTDHMFNPIGSTFEFGETNYFLSTEDKLTNLTTEFWLDLADQIVRADGQADFRLLSEKFILTKRSALEALFFISFLDLPLMSNEVKVNRTEEKLEVSAAQNCIVFYKQMIEKSTEKLALDLIVAQKFFDPLEDHRSNGGATLTEFVRGKTYSCKVTVTNISNSSEPVELVMEVPQGSIPIGNSNFVKTEKFEVGSYDTKSFHFQFYFPAAGEFSCYPATVGKTGKIIRSAEIRTPLVVLSEPKKAVAEVSLKSLVEQENIPETLKWLQTANLLDGSVNYHETLRPLLGNPAFHKEVVAVYRSRLVFDRPLWVGSVFHGELQAFRELLEATFSPGPVDIKEFTIYYLKTGTFDMDCFKAREYDPLVNPRAHFIGDHKHNILNKEFLDTYMRFLKYLVDKPQRTTRDRLQLASYLLLQDRIPEAIRQVSLIENKTTAGGELQLQLDYLLAFASLSQDKPDSFKVAKELCSRYINYPVITWRNKFIEMSNIIAECEGDMPVEKETAEDKDSLKSKIKAEPVLQASVRDGAVVIKHKNLRQAEVHFFVVDIEVKFSIDPLAREESSTFSFINPNSSQVVELASDDNSLNQLVETTHAIPELLRKQNLVIQIKSAGLSFFVNYFSSSMSIITLENLGQIKVLDLEGKPVEKAYVKVFTQKRTGQTGFHKDGYTDFKGNFDFLTLNLEDTDSYLQFSILVFSKQHGSKIVKVEGKEIKKRGQGDTEGVQCKIESADIRQLQEQMAKEKKSKYAIA